MNTRLPSGWPSFREFVTSLIALGVLAYTGAAMWPALTDGDEGLKRAQAIFSLLGPIVGTIIGFYFGTKAGEQVATASAKEVGDLKAEFQTVREGLEGQLAEAEVAEQNGPTDGQEEEN